MSFPVTHALIFLELACY